MRSNYSPTTADAFLPSDGNRRALKGCGFKTEGEMAQNPYNYAKRQGINPVSWEDFHGICKGIAQAVYPYRPEIILAIGRGGYYPGTLLAHILQTEIFPVRVSRRIKDIVKYKEPRWLVKPPPEVKACRVLVVDEICGSGKTISMVKNEVEAMGADQVRSAVLYAHTWGASVPDYIGLITDALLLNPWDREIFKDGTFQFQPEYASALALQGLAPDPSLLINAPALKIHKG
jgi:hypoxanthine phosphoribosyltransferase